MSYEVDFIGVGADEKCGDAITLRFGNLTSAHTQTVVVVDGGYADNGTDILNHVRGYYNSNRIDVVVASHPDLDHVSGLTKILEDPYIEIGAVVMHQPWNHAPHVRALIQDGRVTAKGISDRLRASLQTAVALERLAERRGIPVVEPFSGLRLAEGLFVAGPSVELYRTLVATFDRSPDPGISSLLSLLSAGQAIRRTVAEVWERDTLVEPAPDAVTSRNNSSTVLYFQHAGDSFLFTADVGVPGLTAAINQIQAWGFNPGAIRYVQLPHHGSKRNVGPRLMSTLFGPPGALRLIPQTAIISAPVKGEPKHPSRRVVNAALRRGAQVYVTRGKGVYFRSNDLQMRQGWSAAPTEAFLPEYEDEE